MADAANLGQLRTRLQTLGYGTDSAAAQSAALNSVLRRVVGRRRWPFLEVYQDTLTLTAGDGDYAFTEIAADVLHVDALRIEFGANDYGNLVYKPTQQFRELEHLYRQNGQPEYWTRKSLGIAVLPKPDSAYTLITDYVKTPASMNADGDTHPIPPDYTDVLVWGAIVNMTFRQRDWDGHQWAKTQFNELLREMEAEYGVTQRQNSTHVVTSGRVDEVNRGVTDWWPWRG